MTHVSHREMVWFPARPPCSSLGCLTMIDSIWFSSIKLFRLSICLFWLDWSKCVAWKLVKSPVFCQIDPRTVQVDILKALMPVWGRDGPLLVIPACFLVKMAQIITCLCTFNGQNLPCTQWFWVTTWGALRAKEPCAQRSSASLAG